MLSRSRDSQYPIKRITDAAEIVGTRALIILSPRTQFGYGETKLIEVRFHEASPSGQFILLLTEHGQRFWRSVEDVAVVEELTVLRPSKPPAEKSLTDEELSRIVNLRPALNDLVTLKDGYSAFVVDAMPPQSTHELINGDKEGFLVVVKNRKNGENITIKVLWSQENSAWMQVQ